MSSCRARLDGVFCAPVQARRLFHSVVVVGSGIGLGCGAGERSVQRESDSEAVPPVVSASQGGAVGRSDAFWPAECATFSQFRCDNYSPLEGCFCDGSAPLGPEECGGEPRYACDAYVCPPGASCGTAPNVACRCLQDAPLVPGDCPGGPGQYECVSYLPSPRTCRCNPERPGVPEACAPTDAFVCLSYTPTFMECDCGAGPFDEATCRDQGRHCWYSCVSEMPRYGCKCECIARIG